MKKHRKSRSRPATPRAQSPPENIKCIPHIDVRFSAHLTRAQLKTFSSLTRNILTRLTLRVVKTTLHSLFATAPPFPPPTAPLEVTVYYTDDAEIRSLNRQFRHIDRATDVLSFPMDLATGVSDTTSRSQDSANTSCSHTPLPPLLCLGDLVISLDTAHRNAKRYRTSLPDELTRLLIHGTLHLLGHDHKRPKERTLMRTHERALRKSCPTP